MGLLNKFKRGLQKTRTFVTESIQRITANLGFFDEDMLDELEMVLIQADCGMNCTMELMENIRESIRQTGNSSTEAVLDNLRQGMLRILGEPRHFEFRPGHLQIVLLVGVNGTGKTTTAGKIAHRAKAQGLKVMLSAADTFRAAAIEQLKVWGERCDVPVIAHEQGSDPASVVFDSVQSARARNVDLLLVDTAGRLHNKQNLMAELAKIRRVIEREAEHASLETLLVIDATTGQNAVLQAQAFAETTDVTGIALTKLDGNAKGGVALSVATETSLPLVYAGLGEGIDDLEDFDAELFVESLLPKELASRKS